MEDFSSLAKKAFPFVKCGLEVGDGWHNILFSVFSAINNHLKHNQLPDFKIVQVKEKFADLRIYYEDGDDYISGVVEVAEIMSSMTCERSGSPGKTRNIKGWYVTLSDSEYEKVLEERGVS
jgi:hypothetical protein